MSPSDDENTATPGGDPVARWGRHAAEALSIVWGPRRGSHRAELIGQMLDIEVIHVSTTDRSGWLSALVKYPRQAIATLRILRERRPRLVVVQSPPVFAVATVWWWTRRRGARYIVDAHSTSLIGPVWRWAVPISRGLARRATTTLLPTAALAPVLIGATRAFGDALGATAVDGWAWTGLLAAFAALYVAFGTLAFGVLLEES